MYFDNCRSIDEGRKVYRRLAMANHPDRGGNTAVMAAINAAWESFQKSGSHCYANAQSANYQQKTERRTYSAPKKPRRKKYYTQSAYDGLKEQMHYTFVDDATVFYADDIDGFYMYCHGYGENEIKREIAACVGGNPDDVVLYMFTGYQRMELYEAC